MRTLVWVMAGAVATWLVTAAASRLGVSNHLMPDAAVIVLAFLAMHREPAHLAVVAAALGYLVGRQMLAPAGLNETALVICAVGTYLAAGHLAGSGALFFAVTSGGAAMFYHLVLFLLLLFVRGSAGFANWVTAALVPNALATFVLAWLCYPGLMRLERLLTAERNEGLTWR